MTTHSHQFTMPRAETVPEWKMTTAEWIAHQERLYGPDWRATIDRMDGEAAEAAFYDWFGDTEPFDAAPDLTAYARSTAGMGGVS